MTPREAACALLLVQYKRLRECVPLAARGDADAVHDVRVAVRRTRTILRAFRSALDKGSSAGIEKRLARMGDAMGGSRDLDVLLGFTRRKALAGALRDDPLWPPIRERLDTLRIEERRRLTSHLQNRDWPRVRRELPSIIRSLSGRGKKGRRDDVGLKAFAAAQIEKLLGRVADKRRLASSRAAGELHELRISIRRLRLLSEQVEPLFGKWLREMIEQLRVMERAIGRLHDAEFSLGMLSSIDLKPPAVLSSFLHDRYRRALRRFRAGWRAFMAKEQVARRLGKLAKAQS